MLLSILTTSITATATDCTDVIKAADAAIDAKKKEVAICRLALTQSLEENTRLNADVKDKDEKLGAWYRNPFIVGPIGISIGIIGASILLKK